MEESLDQTGGIGVPATYAATSYDSSVYRLNYAGIFGPDLFVTAAAGQNRRSNSTAPESGDYGPPSYYWQDIGQRTNNVDIGRTEFEKRTDLALGGSWALDASRWGRHEPKAGVSYYDNSNDRTSHLTGRNLDPWRGDGFDDGALVTWTAPGTPSQSRGIPVGLTSNSTKGFGLYLQDTITFGRFTLMLGLRTDTQQVFNDAGQKLWTWGAGDFLQPRVSLVVDLTGDGRTVFKAAYGLFAMPMAAASLPISISRWCPRSGDTPGLARRTPTKPN